MISSSFLGLISRPSLRTGVLCIAPRRVVSVSAKGKKKKKKTSGGEADGREDEGYWSITEPHMYELEVKKSKFIAFAWPVDAPDEAMKYVRKYGDPSASHNCFAYKIGQVFRSTDDGEPGGTAGRPMLSAIESEGLDHVCVMVTRYFGGTKLGTGGLARAYGGSARKCLQEADKIFLKHKVELKITMDFQSLGAIYQLLSQMDVEKDTEEFLDDGTVSMNVYISADLAEAFEDKIQSITSGKAEVKRS